MHWQSASLPQGQARCHPCRRSSPAPKVDKRVLNLPVRVCDTCGVNYKPRMRKQKVCSRACHRRVRPARVCETCAVTFSPNVDGQRRCSRTCNPPKSAVRWWRCPTGAHYFTLNSGRTCDCKPAERRSVQPRETTCAECGTPYRRGPLDGKSTRCLPCREQWNRDQVRLHRDKRRARKRDAYVADVRRADIYVRDKYRCMLCGKKLRMDAAVPHPLAPTIDHIIPLAVGGTHEPANAQAAHFICNARKSAGGGGEQLLLIG